MSGKPDVKPEVVLFEELPTACGRRFGSATLNTPKALNSLSLAAVQALLPQLRRWAADDGIVGVLLQGAGERALCAGADLRTLYESLRASPGEPSAYARAFFAEEYELDYLIHTYAKPILCWGHGVVMGGGIGLMVGASHRVVSVDVQLAMPEITIGLFPDVSGSRFLARMPGHVGRFLALTGAIIDVADARFTGLADFVITDSRRPEVLAAIRGARWTGVALDDRAALTKLLAGYTLGESRTSRLRFQFECINELMAGEDLGEIAARLGNAERIAEANDPWLATAAANFMKGSPTTAALVFELQRRARDLSLADVFRLEYNVALGCCAHGDFAEGIRALIIDKDRTPRWNPASLEGVTPALIEDHLRQRDPGAHRLAALGAT